MTEFLRLEGLTKSYDNELILDIPSLTIDKGEIFSILGPSGCGKTTLLRIIAGFEQPDTGRIYLDGEDITDWPPNRRKINTVFQNYALFPHLTVWENIAFGLQMAGRSTEQIKRAVVEMLELIQLTSHARKFPAELSGGQMQRVAIARALVLKPLVLLLDEPLAALDLKLRQKMLLDLDLIHDEVKASFIFVTHDQLEAIAISAHVAVMQLGKIEQIGTPAQIYETPRSSFVAAFIGDTNFFEGKVVEIPSKDYVTVIVKGIGRVICYKDKPTSLGSAVFLSVRPEKLLISQERGSSEKLSNFVQGIVEDVIYLGAHTKYWVRVNEHRIAVNRQHNHFLLDEQSIEWNDPVWLSWSADDGFMMDRFQKSDEELLNHPPPEGFSKESEPELVEQLSHRANEGQTE